MSKTLSQYDPIFDICKNIFVQKVDDYGTSWRILPPSSLSDLIYLKVARIQSNVGQYTQCVEEKQDIEYAGLVKYAIFALITWSESKSWFFKIN